MLGCYCMPPRCVCATWQSHYILSAPCAVSRSPFHMKELSLARYISTRRRRRRTFIHTHTQWTQTRLCSPQYVICSLRQQLEIRIETRQTSLWNRRVKNSERDPTRPCPALPLLHLHLHLLVASPASPPSFATLRIPAQCQQLNDNSNRARGNYRHWWSWRRSCGILSWLQVEALAWRGFSFQYVVINSRVTLGGQPITHTHRHTHIHTC